MYNDATHSDRYHLAILPGLTANRQWNVSWPSDADHPTTTFALHLVRCVEDTADGSRSRVWALRLESPRRSSHSPRLHSMTARSCGSIVRKGVANTVDNAPPSSGLQLTEPPVTCRPPAARRGVCPLVLDVRYAIP